MPIKEQDAEIEVGKVLVDKPLISAKLGSINRYAILDSITEEIDSATLDSVEQLEQDIVVGIKKAKAALLGVADLMKTLKPKKKDLIDKGKAKAGFNALRG